MSASNYRMLITSVESGVTISTLLLYLFISMTLTVERIFMHVALDAMTINKTENSIHVSQMIARSGLRSATLPLSLLFPVDSQGICIKVTGPGSVRNGLGFVLCSSISM